MNQRSESTPFAALADETRREILKLLRSGSLPAGAVAEAFHLSKPTISHHLKVLAEAGLVQEAPELAKDRRERWWRLVDAGTRWSRADFADDTAAVTAAYAAEALGLQRQFERVTAWNANADTMPDWDDAAFATQNWMRLTPDELREVAEEVIDVLLRWSGRELPDDGQEREPVYVFARGFPAQP